MKDEQWWVKFIHDDVDDGDDAQDVICDTCSFKMGVGVKSFLFLVGILMDIKWSLNTLGNFYECFKWKKKNYISYTKIEKKDNILKMVIIENEITK